MALRTVTIQKAFIRHGVIGWTAAAVWTAVPALAILLWLLLAVCSNASEPGSRRPAELSCPRPASSADGCKTNSPQAVFLLSDLPTHARQSRQESLLKTHPMPFNVPAWDYAIGYDKDAPLRDPTRDRLPEGCVFQPHGAPFSNGPLVDCGASAGRRGPLVIEHWNFYRDGDCIRLRVQASVRDPVIIRNNNFHNGPTCYVSNGDLITIAGGAFPLEVSRNVLDGDHPAVKGSALSATTRGWHAIHDFRRDSGAGVSPGLFQYNVFVRNPGRALLSFSNGDIDFSFNFVEDMGLAYAINGEHVEVAAINNTKPSIVGRWSFINNLIVQGSSGVDHSGAATFYISNGFDDGSVIDDVKIRNNVIIINVAAGGSAFTGAALFSTGHDLYKVGVQAPRSSYAIEATGNYVDPAGAYACALNSPYARKIAGTISGNTLTIDSIGLGAKVFPAGAELSGPGIKRAIIQAFEPGGTNGSGGARIVGRIDSGLEGAGDVLTVTAVPQGVVRVGDPVSGPGVTAGTVVAGALSGAAGGPGRYRVNISQSVAAGPMVLAGIGRYRIDGPPQNAAGTEWAISPDVPTYWGSVVTGDANRSLRDNSIIAGYAGFTDPNARCSGHFEPR